MTRTAAPVPDPASMPATPFTDAASLPLILTMKDVSRVYRISVRTIRRMLTANTFQPLPYDKYPYRWRKIDILRDLETRRPKLKTRRHGFAAMKARRDHGGE